MLSCNLVACSYTRSVDCTHELILLFLGEPCCHSSALPCSCITVMQSRECKMGEYTSTLLSHSLSTSLSFVQTPPHPALPSFCVPHTILPSPTLSSHPPHYPPISHTILPSPTLSSHPPHYPPIPHTILPPPTLSSHPPHYPPIPHTILPSPTLSSHPPHYPIHCQVTCISV